jgi:hypothetical protein
MEPLQFHDGSIAIVTSCTTRKRPIAPAVRLGHRQLAASLPVRTLAKTWCETLAQQRTRTPARNLYLGRAFSDSRCVADALGADLFVVSAGLGLVHAAQTIPNYDLTTAGGPSSIQPALARAGATATDWWAALTAQVGTPHPLAALLQESRHQLLLLALPSSYLELVAADLSLLPADSIDRIRIFTSVAGRTLVPPPLRPSVMPYDDRLEALPGYRGTRSDFPQRAMRHFVEILQGHQLPLSQAARTISNGMAQLTKPVVPARSRFSDTQIAGMLKANWSRHQGSSTRLLRYLRDEALVACEQSRFRSIWLALKADLSS